MEALVAAGVLGIALTALVKLHQSSMRGTITSGRLGEATEVARGLADHFALRAGDVALGCAPGATVPLGLGMPTCAAILGTNAAAACISPNSCDPLVPPGAGNPPCVFDYDVFGDATVPPGGEPVRRRFRVQVVESQNQSGVGTRISAVVCWRDANSTAIRTIISDRLAVQGL